MELDGQMDQDYNDRDAVDRQHPSDRPAHVPGGQQPPAAGRPDDILIEGSIFVRGTNSGLYIESGQRVKFATSFVEVEDGIDVFGRGQTAGSQDRRGRQSVFVDATAVITSFQNGSNINIWAPTTWIFSARSWRAAISARRA